MSIKALLTRILEWIDEGIIYDDFSSPAFSISAGTIGTYATIFNIDVSKSGYVPISVIDNPAHPAAYNEATVLNTSSARIYTTIYRVGTSALSYSTGEITYRVVYKKV